MTKGNLSLILIVAALIAVIILQRSCNKPSQPSVIVKIDTVYQTIRDTFMLDRPVPVEVIKSGKPYPVNIHDTIFLAVTEKIDTAAILSDYFYSRIYKDTAKSKYGYVLIIDTVTQNKIKGRSIISNLSIPEINTTKIIQKNKIFVGLGVGSTGTQLGFGPRLFLLTKHDALYNIGADVLPGQTPSIYYHIGIGWKIHF